MGTTPTNAPFRHFGNPASRPACGTTISDRSSHVTVEGFANIDCRPCLWVLHEQVGMAICGDARERSQRNIMARLAELDSAAAPRRVAASFGDVAIDGVPLGSLVELVPAGPAADHEPVLQARPRCEWVSPDGRAAIAATEARGGATEGDIRALRDRFGCAATAAHELLEASDAFDDEHDEPEPVLSCAAHVGALLPAGKPCNVEPVVWPPRRATITVATVAITPNSPGIARDGFGLPLVGVGAGRAYLKTLEKIRSAALDAADRGVRVVTGPEIAREQEKLRRLLDLERSGEVLNAGERIELDRLLYGCGYERRRPDGSIEHIPAPEMFVHHNDISRPGWGRIVPTGPVTSSVIVRCARCDRQLPRNGSETCAECELTAPMRVGPQL